MQPHLKNFHQLMAQVGLTLHAWNQVEAGMGLLFTSVSGIPDRTKADTIFDSIIAFETRVSVLDAAIAHERHFTGEEQGIWVRLSVKLRKLYKKRHEVAHFCIATPAEMMAGERISPYFTWNKLNQNTAKYLTVAQMSERSLKFSEAAQAIGWFSAIIQRKMMPEERRPPQPAIPPLIARIQELAAQNPEGPQPQPPASPK